MSEQFPQQLSQIWSQPLSQQLSQSLSQNDGSKRRRFDNDLSSEATQSLSCSSDKTQSQDLSPQSIITEIIMADEIPTETQSTDSYNCSSGVSTETSQLLESQQSEEDMNEFLSRSQMAQTVNYLDMNCGYCETPLAYSDSRNQWIQCNDICGKYYHLECVDITSNVFVLFSNFESIEWVCHQCMDRPSKQQKPLFSIV